MANLNRRGIPMPFVSRARRADPPSSPEPVLTEPRAAASRCACGFVQRAKFSTCASSRVAKKLAEMRPPGGSASPFSASMTLSIQLA